MVFKSYSGKVSNNRRIQATSVVFKPKKPVKIWENKKEDVRIMQEQGVQTT